MLTLFQLEFLNSRFVWGDGSTLDTYRVLFDGVGGVYRNLVFRLISIWQAKVVVFKVDVEVRMYKLVFDLLPYYPGHFIAVKFHYWVLDFDLPVAGRLMPFLPLINPPGLCEESARC